MSHELRHRSSSDREPTPRGARRAGVRGGVAQIALASVLVLGVASVGRAHRPAEAASETERAEATAEGSSPAEPTPVRGPVVAFEAHLSLLSDVADRSVLASAFGYALSVTSRVGRDWLVGAKVEHDLWSTFELEGGIDLGALSIAMVVAKLHLDGRVRTTVAAGPSVLLFDTGLDRRGNVGLYVELRPLGIRWSRPRATVVLDPLTFAVIAPVLTNIPLVQIQYRTTLQVEIGGGR
jgi:hypothetical protein